MIWWLVILAAAPVHRDHVAWFPEALAGGQRLEPPRVWDRETVFDYMNGKAEIYLTYAMRQVTTAPYRVGEQRVEVMLFDMTDPAEAYGVWSNDLDGETVEAMQGARYVPGFLRGWQGPLALKIEAAEDTPEFRRFATAIARALAARQPAGPPLPPLAEALPREQLRLKDIRYFHQTMSLDALYYISTRNVLHLSERTAVVLADGQLEERPLKVMVVEYPTTEQRDRAWADYTTIVQTAAAQDGPAGERYEELAPGLFDGVRRVTGPGDEPRLLLCGEARSAADCLAALSALAKTAGRPAP